MCLRVNLQRKGLRRINPTRTARPVELLVRLGVARPEKKARNQRRRGPARDNAGLSIEFDGDKPNRQFD